MEIMQFSSYTLLLHRFASLSSLCVAHVTFHVFDTCSIIHKNNGSSTAVSRRKLAVIFLEGLLSFIRNQGKAWVISATAIFDKSKGYIQRKEYRKSSSLN